MSYHFKISCRAKPNAAPILTSADRSRAFLPPNAKTAAVLLKFAFHELGRAKKCTLDEMPHLAPQQ